MISSSSCTRSYVFKRSKELPKTGRRWKISSFRFVRSQNKNMFSWFRLKTCFVLATFPSSWFLAANNTEPSLLAQFTTHLHNTFQAIASQQQSHHEYHRESDLHITPDILADQEKLMKKFLKDPQAALVKSLAVLSSMTNVFPLPQVVHVCLHIRQKFPLNPFSFIFTHTPQPLPLDLLSTHVVSFC